MILVICKWSACIIDITSGSLCVSALARPRLENDMLAGRADNVTNCCGDLTTYVHETCAAESKCMPSKVLPVLSYPTLL